VKIAIASHVVLDTIRDTKGLITNSLGGPACYCGLTARQFGFKVILATKVGTDFPQENKIILHNNGIVIEKYQIVESPTTRFQLVVNNECRELFLYSKCSPLTVEEIRKVQTDCWLISPVIDEVPFDVLTAIVNDRGDRNFVMLDPQGYTRRICSSGQISLLDNLTIDLSGITAIKADRGELGVLTGGLEGLAGMQFLHSVKGIEFVILTENRIIHFLHNEIHYWINLKNIDTSDSTGVGDILSSAFCCACIKEKDPLWAICFGAGAVRAALETKSTGLNKIPSKSKIEESASYYYNTIEFKSTVI